jgi:ABC-type glycerol-3-phosphate transport system substrate-binding protein
MIIKNILIFSLFISFAYIGEALEINAITSAENGGVYAYNELIDSFNKYSRNNNLDITIKLNLLSKENSTAGVTEYESTIEHLLKKQKSEKYDIIYYDNIFSRKFAPYLVDLTEYLPQEHIDLYQNEITKQTSYYNDKLIGIPTVVDFNVLYYNKEYLNKYQQEPPKTWNELLEIGKYIISEEQKKK